MLRVIACLPCDLETNGLGLPGRLLDPFRGEILLLRVLRRALGCPAFERVYVLASPRDAKRLKGLAMPERCEVLVTEAQDVPQRAWLRRSRKWAVDGWRGGIGWSTSFDEEGAPAALLEACLKASADCVVRLPSHAPYLDPGLLSSLVELHLRRRNTFQFTFAQAPPGLVGEAFHPGFLQAMAKGNHTPRHALMVRKDQEGMDPQRNECHLDCGERIRNSPYRISCESPRLWRLCEALPEGSDAEGLVRHLDAHPDLWRGALPREVLADPDSPEALRGVLEDLRGEGDALVTLGVHADPLGHPRWKEFPEACSAAYGIHLRTRSTSLNDPACGTLMHSRLDVVTVADAWKPEAAPALERLVAAQRLVGTSAPLVCAEFLLTPETEGSLPEWWKAWFGKVDWPLVRGDGPRAPLHLAPPRRRACAKLSRLLYLGPDGALLPCAEGLEGLPGLGRDPASAWSGPAMRNLRDAHESGAPPEPCASCREWAWV